MRFLRLAAVLAVLLMSRSVFAQLQVEDTGGEPGGRKIIIISPGVFKAEVWQASGGGIMGFYNLAVDPEAKVNLADRSRGLFEIGWHGAGFKGPDKEDCCSKHILNKKRFVKDKKTGEMVRDGCYDGCGDWPSTGHAELARKQKDPKVMGTLEIIEKSPARVRVRAGDVPFIWWSKYVHKLEATGTYTFYPTGKIVIAVRVHNTGERPFHWSGEFGPHLMVPGDNKRPDRDRGFTWSTPTQDIFKGGKSEELILAASDKVKTAFLLTIPVEGNKVFDRWMHHNGRGIGWDRAGYGSGGLVMQPGYDETFAFTIQMATPGSKTVPDFRTAKDALPYAMTYRAPGKVKGAPMTFGAPGKVTAPSVPITDDPGDLNKDGFNESEGCYVLKNPKEDWFVFFSEHVVSAPVFKIVGWKDAVPVSVRVGKKKVPFVAGLVKDGLIVQIFDTIDTGEYGIGFQRPPRKGEAVFSF